MFDHLLPLHNPNLPGTIQSILVNFGIAMALVGPLTTPPHYLEVSR